MREGLSSLSISLARCIVDNMSSAIVDNMSSVSLERIFNRISSFNPFKNMLNEMESESPSTDESLEMNKSIYSSTDAVCRVAGRASYGFVRGSSP